MGQAVVLLEDRPEMEMNLKARRASRAEKRLGLLGRMEKELLRRRILTPSAIVRGE